MNGPSCFILLTHKVLSRMGLLYDWPQFCCVRQSQSTVPLQNESNMQEKLTHGHNGGVSVKGAHCVPARGRGDNAGSSAPGCSACPETRNESKV